MVPFPYINLNLEVPHVIFNNCQNQIVNGILWIITIHNLKIETLNELFRKSHTVVILLYYAKNYFCDSFYDLLSALISMSPNVKTLIFMSDIFSLMKIDIFPRDITHIDFLHPLPESVILPKITHTVHFESLYSHKLLLSKNILRVRISTCGKNPLIYPKNIIILSHTHHAPQFLNISKKLKYLSITIVKSTQFKLSKNIYYLLINETCITQLLLPKTIKIFKTPYVMGHVFILPKYMSYLSIYHKLPIKIIIPEELDELNFTVFFDSTKIKNTLIPKSTFVSDNIPNGVKRLHKCIFTNNKMSNVPNITNKNKLV